MSKRTLEMQNEARKQGVMFTEEGDGAIAKDLFNFPILRMVRRAHSRHVDEHNVMKKTDGSCEVSILDLAFGRSSQTSPTVQRATLIFFKSATLNLPEFWLRPEQFLDKIITRFVYKDINFNDYPVFSKSYFLYGKDEATIRNLFTQSGIIRFLEREKGLCIECDGQGLIIYKRIRGVPYTIPPTELHEFINKGQQIYSLLSK